MKQFVSAIATAATIALVGAAPAHADQPVEFTEHEVVTDINPCTGLEHEITLGTTFRLHEHSDRSVVHRVHVLSTSSGFTGQGTGTYVNNGRMEIFRVDDMLTNAEGDRIRAHFVFVADLTRESVRVEKFSLTCV